MALPNLKKITISGKKDIAKRRLDKEGLKTHKGKRYASRKRIKEIMALKAKAKDKNKQSHLLLHEA